MRLLLSTALLLITSVVAPTFARPNSPVVCDLNSGVGPHTRSGNTVNTVASASVTTLTPGGTSTISLQNQNGGFTGFLVYVTDGSGAHAGKMTSTGQATTLSSPCNNNVPTGTTFGHNSQTAKTQLSWTWTAPARPNPPYTIMALVAEAQGVPPLVQVAPITLNVQAAQPATQPPTQAPTQPPVVVVATQAPPVTTQAPATNTNPNPTPAPATNPPTTPPATTTTAAPTPTVAVVATAAPTTATATTTPTIQQLLNTVLVKLQAVLNGTGAVADLKSAIQNLIKQLQTAVQKAKTAKKSANANKPVNVVVSKATPTTGLATAAAGSSAYSIQLGFVEMEDAEAFRDSMVQAASTNSTIHAQSALNDGSLTSGLYYDPAGLDAQGNLQISAATVALYTCPDGTQVSQDMVAVMCPTSTMQAGAPGTTSSSTNPVSDTMFIGIIIGGVVALLLVVAGFVYYQKSKATTTVAPRV